MTGKLAERMTAVKEAAQALKEAAQAEQAEKRVYFVDVENVENIKNVYVLWKAIDPSFFGQCFVVASFHVTFSLDLGFVCVQAQKYADTLNVRENARVDCEFSGTLGDYIDPL